MMFFRLVEALGASNGGAAARASLLAAARSALEAHWQQLSSSSKGRRRRLSFHSSAGPIVDHPQGKPGVVRGSLQLGGSLALAAESKFHHFLFSITALLNQSFQEPTLQSKRFKIKHECLLLSSSKVCEAYAVGGCSLFFSTPTLWFATSPFLEKQGDSNGIKASVSDVGQGGSHNFYDGGTKNGRFWTNVILGLNVLIFVAQSASQGRLLLLGAKVNSLIEKGQMWRLITPALLHANLGHLLVNSYSLNAIGPTVETLGGPKRFLAVYAASAVASSTLSYFLCKAPSVGASGAIFGLLGIRTCFLGANIVYPKLHRLSC
ncbi:hypothetical protein O6H91_18G008300 [Diphasiastrum complanatum]|uniref:Uncharacterized protein n=1 Tax=Diphasiastrum complanatum TaxID=34168 RepID=A0ACC2AY11_DIPCM|nr:hypothetical protein O6H91_18G008300 [Diphasiastrum complanatum]